MGIGDEGGWDGSMKFGIVTFPGSNCDYDAYQAVVEQLGEDAVYLWHKDHDLQGSDVIILPGVSIGHHSVVDLEAGARGQSRVGHRADPHHHDVRGQRRPG